MSLTNILIAIDQLFNTLFGGEPDESISARCWRLHLVSAKWRYTMIAIDALFFWQDEHCKQSYFAEFERKHLPPEYSKEQ